ncbi:hypothetical protein VPH35_096320 [Triticum aestivum]
MKMETSFGNIVCHFKMDPCAQCEIIFFEFFMQKSRKNKRKNTIIYALFSLVVLVVTRIDDMAPIHLSNSPPPHPTSIQPFIYRKEEKKERKMKRENRSPNPNPFPHSSLSSSPPPPSPSPPQPQIHPLSRRQPPPDPAADDPSSPPFCRPPLPSSQPPPALLSPLLHGCRSTQAPPLPTPTSTATIPPLTPNPAPTSTATSLPIPSPHPEAKQGGGVQGAVLASQHHGGLHRRHPRRPLHPPLPHLRARHDGAQARAPGRPRRPRPPEKLLICLQHG